VAEDEKLLRFIEGFAVFLNDMGIPRMPARVFAYVLAQDAEVYSAADLAEGLQVSPAAISTAVRYLVQTGLLTRENRPGKRGDQYRIFDDDVWSTIIKAREPLIRRSEEFLASGIDVIPEGPGARRMRETLEFFRFVRSEIPAQEERWKKHLDLHRHERGTNDE
jgi:DNA-binding transcriptional regulator GbsR (MarR family)